MILSAILFLGGIICLHWLAVLPNPSLLLVMIPLLGFCLLVRRFRPISWFIFGFCWAWHQSALVYQGALPAELEARPIQIRAKIVSVPEILPRRIRFIAEIVDILDHPDDKPMRIRLNWYRSGVSMEPGQVWQLSVKIKRPNGYMNPAGFDYEGWLFQQGINATGYVRQSDTNALVSSHWHPQKIRQYISRKLDALMPDWPHAGLIKALALGMRDDISLSEWDILQKTGTSHLIAISGLHIGLVAGLCFLLIRKLWLRSSRLCHFFPAPKAAAISAMAGAFIYALLAGLGIPTQRALLMVVVAMLAVLLDRQGRPSRTLGLALIVVLFADPKTVLSPGFWLSFAAVGLLIYGMGGRLVQAQGWRSWGSAQWIISIGLLPLTVFIFQKASLISPLANIIAIPWVSLLIVPLVLIGTLLLLVYAPAANLVLSVADNLLLPLQAMLRYMADLPFAQWLQATPPMWALLVAAAGTLLLFAPRGVGVKIPGLVLFMPVFLLAQDRPGYAGFRATILDVGQGLAVVVQTAGHTLVYDTGPRFSARFDAGGAVVLPFLRQNNINYIDAVVISHGDNDHIGGFASVEKHMQLGKLYTGSPEKLESYNPQLCQKGMHWSWDGVEFKFLHPDKRFDLHGNDRSCVLRVSSPGGSLLLPGDIHQKSEQVLLGSTADKLVSDILVAPHHGSKTSSHDAFIKQVRAHYVVFAAGYLNRFRHPDKGVKARYQKLGTTMLDSAHHGAIRFDVSRYTGVSAPFSYRQQFRRHWHRKIK